MKHLLLLKKLHSLFGKEWLLVEEPETLSIMLNRVGIGDSDESRDLIHSLKSIIVSDFSWTDPFVFENIVDGLNANPVIPETLTKPELSDVMYAVKVMTDISPEKNFSESIKKYIASIALFDQVVYLPSPLDMANKYIYPDSYGVQQKVKDALLNPFKKNVTDLDTEAQIEKILAIVESYKKKIT